jgi:hypothetical protein
MSILDIEDAVIIVILLAWMTLDRCCIYFRSGR